MQPSRVVILTLTDVEECIRHYEVKYDLSTAAFLRGDEGKGRISEDDRLQWETYVDFKRELQEMDEEMHREYLRRITQPADPQTKSELVRRAELAA